MKLIKTANSKWLLAYPSKMTMKKKKKVEIQLLRLIMLKTNHKKENKLFVKIRLKKK